MQQADTFAMQNKPCNKLSREILLRGFILRHSLFLQITLYDFGFKEINTSYVF